MEKVIFINNIKYKIKDITGLLTVFQVCNYLKLDIPRFCFSSELYIAGNCRMCLVEVLGSPKPEVSCALQLRDNMQIFTNTALVQKARENILELLLINHPLDCPICDQAGECDLQDQSLKFGSDSSRFFLNKRYVEDKNCSPVIKTIMTRCIHCTRCVRFLSNIADDRSLGTIGRSSSTEISTYTTALINSEFSANIVDLCPVGALTSKPTAMQKRSWEVTSFEFNSFFNNLLSPIRVDVFKNQIFRILPSLKPDIIGNYWIDNKTRFFSDSLLNYRIKEFYFLLNKMPKNKIFQIFKSLFFFRHFKNIKIICGDFLSIESLFFFKKIAGYLGVRNLIYQYQNPSFNNLIPYLHYFTGSNSIFLNLKNTDLCLILGCNTRSENSALNLWLKNRLNLLVYCFGPTKDLTFTPIHVGNSTDDFLKIVEGKHSFCKQFLGSKNPVIILGSSFLSKKENLLILDSLYKINQNVSINLVHQDIGLFNAFLYSYKNFTDIFWNKKNQILISYNLNSSLFKYNKKLNYLLKKNTFIVQISPLFNFITTYSKIIIPSLTVFEKINYFFTENLKIKKLSKILKSNNINELLFLKYFFLSLNEKSYNIYFITNELNYIYYYLKNINLNFSNFINIKPSFNSGGLRSFLYSNIYYKNLNQTSYSLYDLYCEKSIILQKCLKNIKISKTNFSNN